MKESEVLEKQYKSLDEDGNGQVDFETYRSSISITLNKHYSKMSENQKETIIKQGFKDLDANGDGVITKEEFVNRLSSVQK
ncbi:Oidioi.mRNA.OKI2018_I69.PAR.g9055.t1.cds [Oikopleura dioica]|uniref:Oidioi.mRNA.OKI2018_I69.PAR.g9055.t1.cds n=1 Tax=Oikopleura dioica TaxID=34765 RepID=A0ABN7RJU7_OIKDI|nr:Oidioi.mRNA.OKI2018_I69.PAR.g9055.t1.cds [Oikopleura dioica]